MLELTVKTLDSQNHSFTVPDETTVRQLKESILEKIEVPVEIQRLIFHGKVLQDEKKLTDYGDVHGKVIHLVQRPPPPPTRASNANNSSEGNQRGNSRRSHYNNRDRIDGGSSTYLGALAFPPDLMEAQGIQLPPSQRLSRRRLLVAQRMLNQAGASITALENPEGQHSSSAESQEPLGASNSGQSNASGSGREEADMFLGETTGSIARAAQAATAAAIAAAVSAAHAVVVPHITIRGASGQNDTPLSNLETNPNMSDINLNLNIDDNHPEDVAVEVEIGANSDVSVDECHDGDSIANNLDNNPSGSNIAPPRSSVERTSAFAALIEQLEEQQRRFQGLLRRCHQLMVDDPPLTENSSPNAEECQRLFNGVSETMHYFAHAYHALSDIMVDFNEDTPRTLRCRPVLIQQSAILETVFPIQGQINLSTHRHTNDNNSNSSGSESGQANAPVNGVNAQPRVDASTENSANAQTVTETPQQEGGEENVTPHDSASSFTSTATQQSEERSQSSQSGGGVNNTSGFFLSAPGNLEVFMDFRPESVTLGSVETTVILDNEARSRNNVRSSNIQLRNLGSGRTPIELLQSVQAVAGQLQSHLMRRMNQTTQSDQPPPYDVNVQETPSESVMSNQSATSQPHSSASTDSTAASPNVSNSRPFVHVGRAIPEVALNSYDPFLPCNSHHIRSHSRNQNRAPTSQGATARTANDQANANANANPNANGNPERVNLIRVRPRQGTSNNAATTNSTSTPNSSSSRTPRQQNQPAGQPGFIPLTLRNFTQTTLPNVPPMGWLMSGSRAASPGSVRDFLDLFRRSSFNTPGGGQNTLPGSTIAEFLSAIDNSYVEGESIVSDFFMTLARNLTWQDVAELSIAQRTVVESIVTRLHPALQTFVFQRLLQGEPPSEENIARACERIYSELRPYLDVLQEARLRESVDLVATVNNFNQSQIPEIVGLVVETSPNQSENFGPAMTRRVRNYLRQLTAIIIHCCQDGVQGFDTIVQSCVRLFTRGIPEYIQQWTEINSVNNMRYFTATLNVPLEDIQRYLVYRIPSSTVEKSEPTGNAPEPMETDTSQNRTGVWMQAEGMQSPEKVEEPITDSLVDALDADNLPDVLIGSESWHNALPSEWVPIIARDTQRQRRQSSQKPFSDAYLSGLPPKRRKLITSSKPQGSLSQVISDGVRHAISAAGVSSTVAERAIAEAGKDDVLQEAYKEQERLVVSADLRKDPDFTPSRFPNAFKYFDK